MKCSKCGEEIANDSKFCECCGTKLVKNNAELAECKVHVRWLLLVAMILISASNYVFYCAIDKDCVFGCYWDWGFWMLVPVLSFIVFLICLILKIKKKVSWLFTLLMFVFLGLNTVMPPLSDELIGHESLYQIDVTLKDKDDYICHLESGEYYDKQSAEVAQAEIEKIISSANYRYKNSTVSLINGNRLWAYEVESMLIIFTFIEALVTILYLIYAMIAHKKHWKY